MKIFIYYLYEKKNTNRIAFSNFYKNVSARDTTKENILAKNIIAKRNAKLTIKE